MLSLERVPQSSLLHIESDRGEHFIAAYFQESATKPGIRLEVISFSPFIPGSDENQPFLREPVCHLSYSFAKVDTKELRCRIEKYPTLPSTSRCVVPIWQYAGEFIKVLS